MQTDSLRQVTLRMQNYNKKNKRCRRRSLT